MDSLPTTYMESYSSDFDREAINNNLKALQVVELILPGVNSPNRLQILSEVNEYINIIENFTNRGEVIVHIDPKFESVEYKGRKPNDKYKRIYEIS